MKKILTVFLLVCLVVLQSIAVSALTADQAKQEWRDAKQVSKEKQETHRDAKIEFAGDKSEENRQKVVDTGKDVLNAALDEVEAWLVWKELEAQENPDVPSDLKEDISDDVESNMAKIDDLREDVDGIDNQVELGLVFLKMIGKYAELLTDVARNSGKMWVHIGNTHLDIAEDIEAKLRTEADGNDAVIEKLDSAKDSLEEARSNVDKAEDSYLQVKLPGTPLIKFAEGNNYMRTARTNLLSAQSDLHQAYRLLLRGE